MRKVAILLAMAAGLYGQTAVPAEARQADELAIRMLQLVESTAVAVPGLIEASAPVKQNAQATYSLLQRTPRSPAVLWRFLSQMKAYVALADSIPRPELFPPTAAQQFAELREDVQQMQQYFETVLRGDLQAEQKKESDPNDLRHYAAANAALGAPATAPRVVFLGDETTEVWRLNEYFTGRDFVNRGIAGQTTQQLLGRFRQDVLELKPRVVVILAGSADVAAGIEPKQTEDNLAIMSDLAKGAGMKAILASVLPVNSYHADQDPKFDMARTHPPAAIAALNRWMEGYCGNPAAGCIFLNYHPVLVDTAGMLQTGFSEDGLTPNSKALRAMSPLVQEAIGRALTSVGEGSDQKKRRFLPGLPK